ncbi:hypothetical protein J6590_043097 [Homalodisca vitripennis]|nr:hypothetical protein J6590_043097 [Homalodisca vitripennis]
MLGVAEDEIITSFRTEPGAKVKLVRLVSARRGLTAPASATTARDSRGIDTVNACICREGLISVIYPWIAESTYRGDISAVACLWYACTVALACRTTGLTAPASTTTARDCRGIDTVNGAPHHQHQQILDTDSKWFYILLFLWH